MAVAYSQDLRNRVIAARKRGLRTRTVADVFGVSPSWARRVMQRLCEHGEPEPRPRGGVTVVKVDLERLRALVARQPDASARELHERLGVDCSVSAVDEAEPIPRPRPVRAGLRRVDPKGVDGDVGEQSDQQDRSLPGLPIPGRGGQVAERLAGLVVGPY